MGPFWWWQIGRPLSDPWTMRQRRKARQPHETRQADPGFLPPLMPAIRFQTRISFCRWRSMAFLGALAFAAFPSSSRSAGAAPPPVPSGMPTPEERRRMAELASADLHRMMELLHLEEPGTLPPPADDPRRPANTHPVGGTSPNWTDDVPGHTIVRSGWGNWTNYDLASADRYPIPDVLTLKNGARVTDDETWWNKRRPEILGDFQSEIYGRIPAHTPSVTWEVTGTEKGAPGAAATLKHIVGRIDNSGYPAASPSIDIALWIPANAAGPVPVMVVA